MFNHRKHWLHLMFRIFLLFFTQTEKTSDLVIKGYNNTSKYYDEEWTNHMRDLTDDMLRHLNPSANSDCVDLSCGTGYVTSQLAKQSKGKIIGVDLSTGMLEIAKKNHGSRCEFIQSDTLDYLKKQPDNSLDIITYAWALTFSQPNNTLHEVKRVLRPNGKIGIIDNSLSSVYEMFFAGIYTVAEKPNMLKHLWKIHPLANTFSLSMRIRLNGLKLLDKWSGEKTHYVKTGKDAIKRMINTGTASAYQYFIKEEFYNYALKRYPINVEKLYMTDKGIPITHRYIAAIAQKK